MGVDFRNVFMGVDFRGSARAPLVEDAGLDMWSARRSSTLAPSVQEQLLRINEKQFQGGLVFKARRLLYHSTLGRE